MKKWQYHVTLQFMTHLIPWDTMRSTYNTTPNSERHSYFLKRTSFKTLPRYGIPLRFRALAASSGVRITQKANLEFRRQEVTGFPGVMFNPTCRQVVPTRVQASELGLCYLPRTMKTCEFQGHKMVDRVCFGCLKYTTPLSYLQLFFLLKWVGASGGERDIYL